MKRDTKDDFEDGKWYQGKERGYGNVIVYCKAEKRNLDWEYLNFSEYIIPNGNNKYIHEVTTGSWYGRDLNKWEDADMDFVRKFLKPGHPDLNIQPNYEIY